jgi:hypothetical protein
MSDDLWCSLTFTINTPAIIPEENWVSLADVHLIKERAVIYGDEHGRATMKKDILALFTPTLLDRDTTLQKLSAAIEKLR